MPPHMKPQDWVEVIGREYLDSFVKEGGAAIKFAIPLDGQVRPAMFDQLSSRASQAGYLVVNVSAADTKVHMIEKIFFRIAEQIPWEDLSEHVILRLTRDGYQAPSQSAESLLDRIAASNQLDPEFLKMRLDLERKIQDRIFKDRRLSKDFRVAMSQMCLARLTGGAEGETTIQVLSDWLTGRNTAVNAVKPYKIFSSVNKANARHFFESLLQWIRFGGYTGIVVLLDLARVSVAKNPKDDHLYYTKAAVLDTYEVLRQFIDGTDRLNGCLFVVAPDVAFLDEDRAGRGFGAYDALMLRVYDEIRGRDLVNPMASLVRLSSFGGEMLQ